MMRTRPASASDVAYIASTWAAGDSDLAHQTRRLHRVIGALLGRPAAFQMIAFDDQEPSVIVGWVCAERGVLHYIYVREPFRRVGIATLLLDVAGLGKRDFQYSFRTPIGRAIVVRWPTRPRYDLLLAVEPCEGPRERVNGEA